MPQIDKEAIERKIGEFAYNKPWDELDGGERTAVRFLLQELKEDYGLCFVDLDHPPHKPKIICLCGSTRFTEQMLIKQWELTKQGNIVLTWCALPDSYFDGEDKTHIGDQEGVKEIVDEVHLRKIDLANEVLILNINGYIGESTANEIQYAESQGKVISYLE